MLLLIGIILVGFGLGCACAHCKLHLVLRLGFSGIWMLGLNLVICLPYFTPDPLGWFFTYTSGLVYMSGFFLVFGLIPILLGNIMPKIVQKYGVKKLQLRHKR
jgi:hypothetical protein